MPTCVVGGCSRSSIKKSPVNFHRFPSKDASLLRAWVQFVNNTRSNFNLTASTRICSAHFADDCKEIKARLQIGFGQQPSFRLKDRAVPTLKAPSTPPKAKSRPGPTLSTSTGHATATASASAAGSFENRSPHRKVKGVSLSNAPLKRSKQSGGAFLKRERARILQEAEQEYLSRTQYEETAPSSPKLQSLQQAEQEIKSLGEDTAPSSPELSSMNITTHDQSSNKATEDTQFQTITDRPDKRTLSKEYHKALKQHCFRSKGTQTDPRRFFRSRGVQTECILKRTSVMTQCQVVKFPPLQLLGQLHLNQPKQPVVLQPGDYCEVEMEDKPEDPCLEDSR